MSSLAIIGAGAWGTALALQAHRAGNQVTLWSRTPLHARTSPHLRGRPLPDAVHLTTTLPSPDVDAYIIAIPVQHMRAVAARLPSGPPLVACGKGVETRTLRLPLEILQDLHPGRPAAVLTGPNFAHEVAAGLPAAAVIASADPALRAQLMDALGSPTFRLYGNDDPVGAQLGGAAKNVIAIAAGAVMGAGLGENARAALITRGLAELARCVTALGGRPETVAGLSGLGDLLLTCTGPSSRNYRCGLALGQGDTLPLILARTASVIEGIPTAPALLLRAQSVELPIVSAVAALLDGRTTLDDAIAALMARPTRDE